MKKPHVLVTNDDGIDSVFLHVLVRALRSHFKVSVAAPLSQQSWIGRALSRYKQVHVTDYHDSLECQAWALDGTPTDCVNIALAHLLQEPPAAIISGVNLNVNISTYAILSSGTIGGALEGAFSGLPAFAFSMELPEHLKDELFTQHGQTNNTEFNTSLQNAATIAANFVSEKLAFTSEDVIVHNVNFPAKTQIDTAIVSAEPGKLNLRNIFQAETSTSYSFKYPDNYMLPNKANSDITTIENGQISYSLLNYSALGRS